MILYLIGKFLVDSKDPGLKFKRNILVVKVKGLWFLGGADKIDKVGVTDAFNKMHKLLNHLLFFLIVVGQFLVD